MQEILPGVFHWTAEHPEIHIDVSSYYLADARAVLDPIGRPDGIDVDQVILTNRLHGRDAARYDGATVRAPRAGLEQFEGRSYAVEPFDWGDEVATGVVSHEMGAISPDDGVLHIGGAALHFADGLLLRDGRLALMPDNLMDDPVAVREKSFVRLRALAELDFDALLFAHSDPVPSGAGELLTHFLADAA